LNKGMKHSIYSCQSNKREPIIFYEMTEITKIFHEFQVA